MDLLYSFKSLQAHFNFVGSVLEAGNPDFCHLSGYTHLSLMLGVVTLVFRICVMLVFPHPVILTAEPQAPLCITSRTGASSEQRESSVGSHSCCCP